MLAVAEPFKRAELPCFAKTVIRSWRKAQIVVLVTVTGDEAVIDGPGRTARGGATGWPNTRSRSALLHSVAKDAVVAKAVVGYARAYPVEADIALGAIKAVVAGCSVAVFRAVSTILIAVARAVPAAIRLVDTHAIDANLARTALYALAGWRRATDNAQCQRPVGVSDDVVNALTQ